MIIKKQTTGLRLNSCVLLFLLVLVYSCNPLKPIVQNDSLQDLSPNKINKFNGEYEVLSNDTSYPTLAHALTFIDRKYLEDFNNVSKLAEKELSVTIKAINRTHLKVSVLSKNKVIRTRMLKGEVSQNYFQFTFSKLSTIKPFFLVLNRYRKQKNRIGLLENGDLILDTLEGGVLLLIIMPTFGGDYDNYNLIFKRKK